MNRRPARSLFVVACTAAGLAAAARGEYPVQRPPRSAPVRAEGEYTVFPDRTKQVIKGLGFEIQSDSIASGNHGLPEAASSVPHDLTAPERERFCRELLRGFRYCRLAGGLYWRGLDAGQKQFQARWPAQLDELREVLQRAGVEGLSLEYWSPAPYWKASGALVGQRPGTCLKCFVPAFANDPIYHGDVARFLEDFAAACRQDVQTLRAAGLPVVLWGLQNEPFADTPYSSCVYTPEQYSRTFAAVAPLIRALDPKICITADDAGLEYIAPALADPRTAALVDAFAVHHIGSDSAEVKSPRTCRGVTRPSFQNEYEYLDGPASPDRCLNTVQHIMNWFARGEAPTWFWIHALKPVGNSEASGYALGFWRSPDYQGPVAAELADLAPGHWTWNRYNSNAVLPFVRRMPWDSQAVAVQEERPDEDLRVFAFRRPDRKLVVVLSNRSGASFRFRLKTGLEDASFTGYRYTPESAGEDFLGTRVGTQPGRAFAPQLADRTWEFWVQD